MTVLMTTKEAADYLRHSEVTLEQWRLKGEGPVFYKPSGKVIYDKDDLDLWLKGKSNATEP